MNMKRWLITVTACVLASSGLAFGAKEYGVDPNHSHIGFKVRHMSVANVRGEFREFSSDLMVDEEDMTRSSIEVRIKAASIDTRLERRDEHLRSSDFLDVANHPEIVFKSKHIEHAAGDEYWAIGDLTIRGVTKEVELPVALSGPIKDPLNMMRLGVEGSITINRQDYGVIWNRALDTGGFMVGNEVTISLSIEAARRIEEESGSSE